MADRASWKGHDHRRTLHITRALPEPPALALSAPTPDYQGRPTLGRSRQPAFEDLPPIAAEVGRMRAEGLSTDLRCSVPALGDDTNYRQSRQGCDLRRRGG
jgi:hypothetical protein